MQTIPANPSQNLRFDDQGNISRWQKHTQDWVEYRPIRQNTRCDFLGMIVWVKSASDARRGDDLLHAVDWDFETRLVAEGADFREYERGNDQWTMQLLWKWTSESLSFSAQLSNGDGQRSRQLEFACWVPEDTSGVLHSTKEGKPWLYQRTPFGRVKTEMLDRDAPLKYVTAKGQVIELQAITSDTRAHYYHRGFSFKIGSGSSVASPNHLTDFSVRFVVSNQPAPQQPLLPRQALPDLQDITRSYSSGLMLHLQYTELPHLESLLKKWIVLAKRLGFDFLMLELDRGLRIHPKAAFTALSLEQLHGLATFAKAEGIPLQPMFNLLGHQWETRLLEWKPSWKETNFSALCPSHPEVRAFVVRLIKQLIEAFDCSLVHIGGDEMKIPDDGNEELHCPRCGDSPNFFAVIDYWNFLQQEIAPHGTLAIWGDQLIPPSAISEGLIGYNMDGRSVEYLEQLDRQIQIIDGQYSNVSPISSIQHLQQKGHTVALASAGVKSILNPFVHAEVCRKEKVATALHTTWTSPDPHDLPLEGVIAAALAHSGQTFDSNSTPELCARLACQLMDELIAERL